MSSQIIEDMKSRLTKIQGIEGEISIAKDRVKELSGDLRYEVKKFNKIVERHPEVAASAEIKAIVKPTKGDGEAASAE